MTTPVPSGLVRKRRSPGRAPALVRMRSGWIVPVTQRPYFGSASVTVWPPAMTAPASATLSAPPAKMAVTDRRRQVLGEGGDVEGEQRPRRPSRRRRSWRWRRRSRRRCRGRRRWAGRSRPSGRSPARRTGGRRPRRRWSAGRRAGPGACCSVKGRRTCARAAGPILDAQPAQLASVVSRISSRVCTEAPFQPPIARATGRGDDRRRTERGVKRAGEMPATPRPPLPARGRGGADRGHRGGGGRTGRLSSVKANDNG